MNRAPPHGAALPVSRALSSGTGSIEVIGLAKVSIGGRSFVYISPGIASDLAKHGVFPRQKPA